MTRQILLGPPSVNRRHSLLSNESPSSSGGNGGGSVRFAEVAGGTTAECAAVCCCCPCGLVNLLVLAVYKIPAGLFRKALRRTRRRRMAKKGLLPQRRIRCDCGCDDTELQIHPLAFELSSPAEAADKLVKSMASDQDVIALEKEMWERFYGTGFWRSSSQRE